MPAIALALAHALGLTTLETQVALAHAAVPTATSAYILAQRMNGRGAPVALIDLDGDAARRADAAALARAARLSSDPSRRWRRVSRHAAAEHCDRHDNVADAVYLR